MVLLSRLRQYRTYLLLFLLLAHDEFIELWVPESACLASTCDAYRQSARILFARHTKHLHDFCSASSRDSAWCRRRCLIEWQTRWENNTALTAVIRQREQMFSKYLPFTSVRPPRDTILGSCFICGRQNDRKFLRQFKCSTPNNTAIGHTKAAMSSATLKPFTYSQPPSGRSITRAHKLNSKQNPKKIIYFPCHDYFCELRWSLAVHFVESTNLIFGNIYNYC